MKLFKTADEKLSKIGFLKTIENKCDVTYERRNEEFGYTQVLSILQKMNAEHIIQSYDKDLFDEEKIGNVCVGLTAYEMKLVLEKMKEMNWR